VLYTDVLPFPSAQTGRKSFTRTSDLMQPVSMAVPVGCKQATRCSCDLIPSEQFAACLWPNRCVQVYCHTYRLLASPACQVPIIPAVQPLAASLKLIASTIIYHPGICMLPPVNLVLFNSFAARHNTCQSRGHICLLSLVRMTPQCVYWRYWHKACIWVRQPSRILVHTCKYLPACIL